MTRAVIEIDGVCKSFGDRMVLNDLNLTVPEQSIFAFLGNNGQGKSTTIRLITGLIKADRGTIRVLGHDIRSERQQVLGKIGCLIDSPSLYPNLNAVEFLSIGCAIKGLERREIDRVLEQVGLRNDKSLRIGRYSLGMKQRLALGHALLGKPRLLILDEPTNGLDPEGIQDVRKLLTTLPTSADCTIFFSSHQLDEVEKIASHVAVLRGGSTRIQSAISELVAQHVGFLSLEVCDAGRAAALLEGLGYVAAMETPTNVRVSHVSRHDACHLHVRLMQAGISLFESVYRTPSLEAWFLQSSESSEHTRDN